MKKSNIEDALKEGDDDEDDDDDKNEKVEDSPIKKDSVTKKD